MVLVLMVLILTGNLFAQEYSNNGQYLDNPYSAICHYKNIVTLEETIHIKTNIMHFSNEQGSYNINFSLLRNLVDFHRTMEFFIKVRTPKLITPFDNLDQDIVIILADESGNRQWRKIASFNKREAFLEIEERGYSPNSVSLNIKIELTPEDLYIIKSFFYSDSQVMLYLMGLEGNLGFAYPREVANVYKTFFDYIETIYE